MTKFSGYTLLIVDDEDFLREILKETYDQLGFRVLVASGGNAAFEIIQNNQIDIVLSDVKMPQGDGIQLLKAINKIEQKRPIVLMMTGFSDLTPVLARELGAAGLISKPFQYEDLVQTITKVLENKSPQ